MTDKDREIQWLCAENERLKRQIERYVIEFRVCRFCKHMHEDCSPTGIECTPVWGGL